MLCFDKQHMLCFECDQPADHQHHVIPRSRGGTRTVPLCAGCHGLVHDRMFPPDHVRLIREGLTKARAAGVIMGRPRIGAEMEAKVLAMRTTSPEVGKMPMGLKRIAAALGIGPGTALRIVREWELQQGD